MSVTDNIVLAVTLTGGARGTDGGGYSVDYTELAPNFTATQSNIFSTVPHFDKSIGFPAIDATAVTNINALRFTFAGTGSGLLAGQSAYLGTITFHEDTLENGTFEVKPFGRPGQDAFAYRDTGTQIPDELLIKNTAFVVNVPEPGALSLLVMGLGGMLLAGRGRRS